MPLAKVALPIPTMAVEPNDDDAKLEEAAALHVNRFWQTPGLIIDEIFSDLLLLVPEQN